MTHSPPPELPKAPSRWGRVFAVVGLLGIGVYGCTQWAGDGFRKMLAFTTADTDALRRLSPDPTKPKFRFTLKTDVVESASCPEGLAFCTYDRLRGEKDTIKLPRSITYEFPTLLVNGIEKDRSGIYLSLWHKSLDPAFFGGTPVDTLMVLDEKGEPTPERWKDRQVRNMREEKMVHVTLRSFYYSASSRFFREFDRLPTAPTCDIEDRGNGVFIYRHKPGFVPSLRNDPEMQKLMCQNDEVRIIGHSIDGYKLYMLDDQKKLKLIISCYDRIGLCDVSSLHENWGYFYKFNRSIENEFLDVHRRVTDLIKSSIVDRSYPIPAEGTR
jgi:hypothetical protein